MSIYTMNLIGGLINLIEILAIIGILVVLCLLIKLRVEDIIDYLRFKSGH